MLQMSPKDQLVSVNLKGDGDGQDEDTFEILTCPFSGAQKVKLKSTILELKKNTAMHCFKKSKKGMYLKDSYGFLNYWFHFDYFVIARPLVLSTTKILTCPYVTA